jgi:hypothetical protein
MNPTPTTGARLLELALTWVGRAGSTAAQGSRATCPATPVSVDHLGGQDGHGVRRHPPSIALAAHGMPDPVEVSYLSYPAFADSRHEQPGDESLPVERRLVTSEFRRPGINDRRRAAGETTAI